MKKFNSLIVSLVILSGCNIKNEKFVSNLDTVNNILYNCIEEYNKVREYEQASELKEGNNSIVTTLKFNDNKKEFYTCVSEEEKKEEIYVFFENENFYELDSIEMIAEKKIATEEGLGSWLKYRSQAYSFLDTIISSEIALLEMIKPLLETNVNILGMEIICDNRNSISFSVDNYETEEGVVSFNVVIEDYLLTNLEATIDGISSKASINYTANIEIPNIEGYEIKNPLENIDNNFFG